MAATSIPKKAKLEGGKSGGDGPSLLVGMKPPSPKPEPIPKTKPSPAANKLAPTRQPPQPQYNTSGNGSQPPPHYGGRPPSGLPLHLQAQFGAHPAQRGPASAQPPAVHPQHYPQHYPHHPSMNRAQTHLLDARRPAPQTQAERRTLSHLEALSVLISKKVREDRQARDEAALADPFLTVLDEREQKRQAREKRRREESGQTDMVNIPKTDCFLTVYENIETKIRATKQQRYLYIFVRKPCRTNRLPNNCFYNPDHRALSLSLI